MKRFKLMPFILLVFAITGCQQRKVNIGCTDPSALDYDSTAIVDNGVCKYIAGVYSINDSCLNANYKITIEGSYQLTLRNLANIFDSVYATRTGLSINIPFQNQKCNIGIHFDIYGDGTISPQDGRIIKLTYYYNRFLWQPPIRCLINGTK